MELSRKLELLNNFILELDHKYGWHISEETYALCCNFVWFINTKQGIIRKPQTTKYKINTTSFDFTMLETKVGRKITKNIVNNTLLYDIEKRGFIENYFFKK